MKATSSGEDVGHRKSTALLISLGLVRTTQRRPRRDATAIVAIAALAPAPRP